jgi:hypothetical protein
VTPQQLKEVIDTLELIGVEALSMLDRNVAFRINRLLNTALQRLQNAHEQELPWDQRRIKSRNDDDKSDLMALGQHIEEECRLLDDWDEVDVKGRASRRVKVTVELRELARATSISLHKNYLAVRCVPKPEVEDVQQARDQWNRACKRHRQLKKLVGLAKQALKATQVLTP